MRKSYRLAVFAVALLLYPELFACEEGVLEIPKEKVIMVEVDGYIKQSEYPITYKNPYRGIALSWVCDDSLVHVGLSSDCTGWIGLAFGSTTTRAADMILFACLDDSVISREELWSYKYLKIRRSMKNKRLIVKTAGRERDNGSTFEFSYRLCARGFKPSQTYGLLIAYNDESKDFSQQPTDWMVEQFSICPGHQ
ncbi:hypothetical protein JXO59_09630 [candidate division KSB1 bacterium]|nr:hypothetical protein [candidate division KSB1 bacterium]